MNQVGAARNQPCRDCGEPVLEFDIDIFSWSIRLQDHDLPINGRFDDLLAEYRLWEFHGPHLGWSPKYGGQRTWRPLRATHICPDSDYIPLFNSKAAAAAYRAERDTHDRPDQVGGKHKTKHKEKST